MLAARLGLIRSACVERPDAGANRQIRTRKNPRRLRDTILHLTRIARRPEVDEQPIIAAEHDGLADVVPRIREAGYDDLGIVGRHHLACTELEPKHAIVRAEVETAVAPRQTAAAQPGAELRLLVGASVSVAISQTDDAE